MAESAYFIEALDPSDNSIKAFKENSQEILAKYF